MDQTFNILVDDELVPVEAEIIPIKGYKGISFTIHKMNQQWTVSEYSTGLSIATATTKADAKKEARAKLAEQTGKDKKVLERIIDSKQKINDPL